ncbi:STAS domain-containing protein [Rhodobacteraceae bacterium NNCM2]|nr:STAS domain-containing protein [Coraliihabitans acroporae]
MGALQLEKSKTDGFLIVTPPGPRLDAAVATDFRSSMAEIIAAGEHRIQLDLSRVEFIDSAGLGSIIKVLKMIDRAGELELTGVKGVVYKVLKLTRMNRIFTIREMPGVGAG